MVAVTTVEDAGGRRLTATVVDGDLAVVNAIRRVVLADVPYVALYHEPRAADDSRFAFHRNTSVLHDHLFGHRMSMAPLHLTRAESQAYIPGSLRARLAVENAGTAPLDVTTRDVQLFLHDQPHPDRDRLYPADPDTGDWPLLNVLKPGEALHVEATAVAGTAARHAAFAVASLCTFSLLLDEALVAAGRAAAEAAAGGDAERASNRFEHVDRKRCWAPGPDGRPTAFALVVESECGMPARDVLAVALDVLERKVATATCVVADDGRAPDPDGHASVVYEIAGEDHTLGNLLQSAAVDAFVGAQPPGDILYVGYMCPHALERVVELKAVLRRGGMAPLEAFEAIKAAALAKVVEFKAAVLAGS